MRKNDFKTVYIIAGVLSIVLYVIGVGTGIYISSIPSSVENKTTTTSSSQSAATVAVQNAQSGKTAETGPGILIYTLLPLGAFILKRKKKYGESK